MASSGSLVTAAVRVIARAVALQVEEVAAAAGPSIRKAHQQWDTTTTGTTATVGAEVGRASVSVPDNQLHSPANPAAKPATPRAPPSLAPHRPLVNPASQTSTRPVQPPPSASSPPRQPQTASTGLGAAQAESDKKAAAIAELQAAKELARQTAAAAEKEEVEAREAVARRRTAEREAAEILERTKAAEIEERRAERAAVAAAVTAAAAQAAFPSPLARPTRIPPPEDEVSIEEVLPSFKEDKSATPQQSPPVVKEAVSKAEAKEPLAKVEAKSVSEPVTVDEVKAAVGAVSRLPVIERDPEEEQVMLRTSTVPSSRLGRLFHYGSLAASLGIGAATESIRRSTGRGGSGSVFMSDTNVRRLVATLGRMRGAALKLGQFMSIQDNTMLPPEIEQVLAQVQQHANYMPDWQMEKVMATELGADWMSHFGEFDRTPVAAASIGQVHRATLPDGTPAAVKIQFPGVASSIDSDIANVTLLLRGAAVLPKGLYLENTVAVMKRELEDECDYVREGAAGATFYQLLKDDPVFEVPRVVEESTTPRVLTTEWMGGKPLSKMKGMTQAQRDLIGTNILRLCLRELFTFRFMQTDPNWANFMFDSSRDKLQLIDFGASRAYTKEFMDGWYRLLHAALAGDKEAMTSESISLGYLTGEEEPIMVDAHLRSMTALASPFQHDGIYPFADQTITDEVRALIPVMLQHRLTPPPAPTYSLNRKLSGAFLMCSKLGANVDCKKLWKEEVEDKYKLGLLGEGEDPAGVEAQAQREEVTHSKKS